MLARGSRLASGALIVAALVLAPALQAENSTNRYSRRIWQTQDGLPQDTISALVQTRDGYLWMLPRNGQILMRFQF